MGGQTGPHISLFSPEEVEFMAEDELVEIVPNMNMDLLSFIGGGFWSVRSSDSDTSASVVRSLVEDIRDVRLHKLETNLGSFQGTSAVKIENVSAREVNLVPPYVRRALEAFYKHDKAEADADRDTRSGRQPREANNEPRRDL